MFRVPTTVPGAGKGAFAHPLAGWSKALFFLGLDLKRTA
jgi:hypothetical protein